MFGGKERNTGDVHPLSVQSGDVLESKVYPGKTATVCGEDEYSINMPDGFIPLDVHSAHKPFYTGQGIRVSVNPDFLVQEEWSVRND